jgi:hypothetical protein
MWLIVEEGHSPCRARMRTLASGTLLGYVNDLCIIITKAAPRPPDWGAGELWRVYKALVRRTAKYTATIL